MQMKNQRTCLLRAQKSAIPLSQTSRFSYQASNISLLLAQWARDRESHESASKLRLGQEQAKFESYMYLSQGPAGIQGFSSSPVAPRKK